jgi:uncharacterized protein
MSIPGSATLADITSTDWSLMLDSTAAKLGLQSGLGNVVQGLTDVDQCIAIILTTPKGTDPFRPTFGCDLWQYIDQPINIATAHIVREVFEAITTWEPRAIVESVAVAPVLDGSSQSGAHLTISVTWQINLGGAPAPKVTTVITPPTTVPQGQN